MVLRLGYNLEGYFLPVVLRTKVIEESLHMLYALRNLVNCRRDGGKA